MLTFNEYLASVRPTIEQALRSAVSATTETAPQRLVEAMRYAVLAPGKRVRAALVLLACEACRGDEKAALPAACAVELIHTYSLVHDDLPAMDNDTLRRGQPTCHIKFDEATAILVGDALIPAAFELLLANIQPSDVALRCCSDLAKTAGATQLVGGQADDIYYEKNLTRLPTSGAEEFLTSIHLRKTAALLAHSLRLGAYVAGASKEQVEVLAHFGINLGLAFQITDDLLDVTSSAETLGKSVGKDAKADKLTYPALHGVVASQQKALALIEDAKEMLIAAPELFAEGPREVLGSLADFILLRKK